MSGSESRWVVFIGSDGFPIELEPGVKMIDETVKILLKCVV